MERALAAEIIRYRRALRSHSDLLGRMTTEYLETRDITWCLKVIIEGKNDVGGADTVHFDILQVPEKGPQYLNNEILLHAPR